ncbi:hypothetical protein H4R24_002042 [Coemansia sp. RSA 988]|nr:hypothetical protein H4R24_002042 [Coemansia sp. RSA 988]
MHLVESLTNLSQQQLREVFMRVQGLLEPPAAAKPPAATVEPQISFDLRISDAIRNGTLFDGINSASCGSHAYEVFCNMTPTDHNAVLIANALWNLNPVPFAYKLCDPNLVRTHDMEVLCQEFNIAHDLLTRKSTITTKSATKSNMHKKKHTHGGSAARASATSTTPRAPTISPASNNALKPKKTLSREKQQLTPLPGLRSGSIHLRAVADTGAEVSLIAEQTVKRLGLRMSTKSRPLLKSLCPDSPAYHSVGRVNVLLCLDDSPPIWVRAVVVDFDYHWDVLVGDKELRKLEVRLITSAMQQHISNETQTVDHPPKTLDASWRSSATREGI